MTLDELSDRELDVLVVERVMGWRWYSYVPAHHPAGAGRVRRLIAKQPIGAQPADMTERNADPLYLDVPHYSTDMNAAMTIVEHMKPAHRFTLDTTDNWYLAAFVNRATVHEFDAQADSAPRAICLAALKALGVTATEVAE